jgi:poly(3-hydroxybutyrate) depolymerase
MGLDGIRIVRGTVPGELRAPMLVYWHGSVSTSDEYVQFAAPIASGITEAGGIIVSFQGTTGGDLYSGTSIFGVGDLKLADQLVACAVRDANIDPRRIYTTGCSAGGLFATAMGALRSSYIAAVAPNSGGFVVTPPFDSMHTPALMTVHEPPGTNAGILDFAQTCATADKAFKARGGFVIDCNTGAGTCGGGPLAGDVWKFFQAHPFAVTPEPWTGLPLGFSTKCMIQ